MLTQRHTHHPAEQWQAWIDEHARSGLSQRVFCEQKGLSKSLFQHWKRRLAPGAAVAPSSTDEAFLFAPVSIPSTVQNHADDEPRGWEIELDLGGVSWSNWSGNLGKPHNGGIGGVHDQEDTTSVLRHSCAVSLLQSDADITVIRDYLGHASVARGQSLAINSG